MPASLEALIRELSRLPGVGPKSASRLAFHILKAGREDVERLSRALVTVKSSITRCARCGGIAEAEYCAICTDPARDHAIICVVEEANDVLTVEKTGEFKGTYHVLGGVIAPLDGIGPDDLNITSLLERVPREGVREIIVATNPTVEGDATSLYLAGLIKPLSVRVMRIAHGLPAGADLEFADSVTIARSIAGRVDL
ncbi:MAG: recombination protein RecR [Spirochaetes bacterium]|nr:MAG: recombination protein RecR [Spirochaetota bacterium]